MNDLISRRAAIEAICRACSDDFGECPAYTGESSWCEEIVALRAVPSAQTEILACGEGELLIPKPRWIPVSERLPEEDGEMYLVTDYCEQINRERIHISYCYVNRLGFWSDVPKGYKVVAWMPIEPWKGENK